MRFTWKEYSAEYQDIIDSWCDELAEHGLGLGYSYQEDYEYYTTEEAETLNETYANKVVFEDGVPVGAMAFLIDPGPKYLPVPLVTIHTIITAPEYRNKGYGAAIIKEAIEHFGDILPAYKGVSCVFDAETEENPAGDNVLKRAGFVFAVSEKWEEHEGDINWWICPEDALEGYKREREYLYKQG